MGNDIWKKNKAIDVELWYEIENGMAGMMRDVILRLCSLMYFKVHNVRVVVGMSKEHFLWKSHMNFKRIIFSVPHSFCENMRNGCVHIVQSSLGMKMKCVFSHCTNSYTSTFVNKVIYEGVWRWTVQILYPKEKPEKTFSFSLGIAPSDHVLVYRSHRSACLEVSRKTHGLLLTDKRPGTEDPRQALVGPNTEYTYLSNGVGVPDRSLISVEVDMSLRRLFFFINGRMVPSGFIGFYQPISFGGSVDRTSSHPSLASISLCRVPVSAAPSTFLQSHYFYDMRMDACLKEPLLSFLE